MSFGLLQPTATILRNAVPASHRPLTRTAPLAIVRQKVRYGERPEETCDVITPNPDPPAPPPPQYGVKGGAPVVVYVHGGGWVAVNSAVLLHSVTCFGRAGMKVYSVDYPLSPEHQFPVPLHSLIKAIRFLKAKVSTGVSEKLRSRYKTYHSCVLNAPRNKTIGTTSSPILFHAIPPQEGVEEVVLLGDSAGGNLVTMAAAVIAEKQHGDGQLVKSLAEMMHDDCDSWDLPKVS